MIVTRTQTLLSIILTICLFIAPAKANESQPIALRIATFNIEDVRSADLDDGDNQRLQQIAAIIQRLRPNILLLSEIAIRQDGTKSNADRFVEFYLAVPQANGLRPILFDTYTPPSNTGIHSGFDLDNSGGISLNIPDPSPEQTDAGRAYGNDCYGFGTFPGQYAMALLVNPKLTIHTDHIRTFQHFLWKDLPDFSAPTLRDGSPWYAQEEWDNFRLVSKNFADVPILLPNGTVLHALISHPTPPAFDGLEERNKRRNHDEIKFIRHYIDNDQALADDLGTIGGLDTNASFVIMGDLNADPTDGYSRDLVMVTQIITSPRLAKDVFPSSDIKVDRLDSTDTAQFRLRVDYVLPSRDIKITNSGIWRLSDSPDNPEADFPSDHFPVWMEMIIP